MIVLQYMTPLFSFQVLLPSSPSFSSLPPEKHELAHIIIKARSKNTFISSGSQIVKHERCVKCTVKENDKPHEIHCPLMMIHHLSLSSRRSFHIPLLTPLPRFTSVFARTSPAQISSLEGQ